MQAPTISYLSRIYFRNGAIGFLPDLLHDLNISRPLIVTDAGVMRAGLANRTQLQPSALFDRVLANPTEANANDAVNVYRSEECDGIVALGGGSSIDCAKAAALLVTHPPPLEQYAFLDGGFDRIGPEQPPVVAIPTTAGTGAEVGRAALMNLASGVKKALLSPHLIPNAVICDPELTVSLPSALTAATGMDALTHCIEAYVCKYYAPMGKAIALGGIELIAESLVRAFEQGDDIDARTDMSMAAVMGGFAFGTGGGLGTVHAMAHQLSTEVGLPHGLANAILLPHVMAFNGEEHAEAYVPIARALGVDTDGMTTGEASQEAVTAVRKLCNRLDIPQNLRETGSTQDHISGMARQAMDDVCVRQNPRVCTEDDIKGLYEQAL